MGGCPHTFFSPLLESMVMAELLKELSGVTYDADDVNSSVMVGKSQLLINPNKMVVMPLNRKVSPQGTNSLWYNKTAL
jgi:hypothetical protein